MMELAANIIGRKVGMRTPAMLLLLANYEQVPKTDAYHHQSNTILRGTQEEKIMF